jgi:hypothetical protein
LKLQEITLEFSHEIWSDTAPFQLPHFPVYKTHPCVRLTPKIKTIFGIKIKIKQTAIPKLLKSCKITATKCFHVLVAFYGRELIFVHVYYHYLEERNEPKLTDCGRFKVYLHWLGCQPSLYKTQSDLVADFKCMIVGQ